MSDLHQLIVESSIALAVMALISAALGWLVAGRVLRPLRTMTATTQQISETSLDRRLAMEGPRDELRQLADTIDGLLERLEAAFDAQRRFVANASHELRTPLTAARAMLEMIISDPNATVDTFRETCVQVLDESEQQEQLIDALLALAQGQRGIVHREAIDLAALVGEVVARHRPEADLRGLTLDASLEPALVSGDRRLIERLASNLVENAIRHNITSGHVGIRVAPDAGRASLEVVNTGPRRARRSGPAAAATVPAAGTGTRRATAKGSGSGCRSSPRSRPPTAPNSTSTPRPPGAWTSRCASGVRSTAT